MPAVGDWKEVVASCYDGVALYHDEVALSHSEARKVR